MEIRDRVALVTGAASGIGRASAARLRADGARVVIADIDTRGGAAAAADVDGDFLELDVRDASAWEAATEEVVAEHGSLDIVHLNAGLLTPKAGKTGGLFDAFDVATLLDDDYRRLLAVNIDGVVFGCRAAVRAMEGHPGAIVATASVAGVIPYAGDPLYSMTKHAVVGFVRSMAPLLSPRGITINAICPGVVETNISDKGVFELARNAGIGVMQPERIADAVAQVLASDETGQALLCLPNAEPSKPLFPVVDVR